MINEHDLKDHECPLYELSRGDRFKLIKDEEVKTPPASNEFKLNDVFRFENVDGMYSYCTDMAGAVHHFAAWTKVRKLT